MDRKGVQQARRCDHVSLLKMRGLLTGALADAQMKVSLDVLQRVYEAFQGTGENGPQGQHELLDPESHLHIINAFDMPLWHWSHERSTFERHVAATSISHLLTRNLHT